MLIVGCNNAERDELLGHLDDFDTERNGVSEILCRCPETLGYTTTGECLLNQGDLSDADKECIADAFDGRDVRRALARGLRFVPGRARV